MAGTHPGTNQTNVYVYTLTAGPRYFYIKATNSCGEGAQSNTLEARR